MSEVAEKLKSQIAGLSPEDRVELMDYLIELDTPEEIKAAWDAELERRWRRIESGETTGIPFEKMVQELKEKYG